MTKRTKRQSLAVNGVVLLALSACSGGGFTPNFSYAAAFSTLADGGPDPTQDIITLVDFTSTPVPSTCSDYLSDYTDGGSQGSFLGLVVYTDGGFPVGPGDYAVIANPSGGSVPNSNWAYAASGSSDAGGYGTAVSGTVTLTAVGATVSGNYTLMMVYDGGAASTAIAVNGSFGAQYCADLQE